MTFSTEDYRENAKPPNQGKTLASPHWMRVINQAVTLIARIEWKKEVVPGWVEVGSPFGVQV
jgi:hypothetical protein